MVINKISLALHHQINHTKKKAVMKLQLLTLDEIKNHKEREYNPREWDKIIARFASYEDCKFYIEIESHNAYDRFFAIYKLPEGFSVLTNVSYSSCLTSAGFSAIRIAEDGTVIKTLFSNGGGVEGRAENCKSNRAMFARLGLTVTTCI